ncbi:sel1 repeat family protein [Streptomyces sp. NBC_01387]|uniref:tetratricopeptide repeat protein n=1 Tax=Streptomyces sp. NBC_01387 TaxID=2903849 RepID=UPI00324A4B9D
MGTQGDRWAEDGAARVSNGVSGGTVGPVVQSGYIGSVHFNGGTGPLPESRQWPPAADADPVALGVRRPWRAKGSPDLPLYIRRDTDDELRHAVREVAWTGGLVLVTGEPFSGKTMSTWAAMTAEMPNACVLAPRRGVPLHTLPPLCRTSRPAERPRILWLDDLPRYLGENPGENGLEPGLLNELQRQRVVVLATMRNEVYERVRYGTGPASTVLDMARATVDLASEWSDAEFAGLAWKGDPRLNDVHQRWRPTRRVGEYLAVGPLLWDEWQRSRQAAGRRRGHALVQAAIDLARCEVPGPVSALRLREAHEFYLDAVPAAGRESLDEAFDWASGVRHGVTGLLVPGEEQGTWRAFGSLVVMAAHDSARSPVPLAVWRCALRAAEGTDGHDAVVKAAAAAYRSEAEAGSAEAMFGLADLFVAAEDMDSAEEWLRKAAEAGHVKAAGRLGRILVDRGEFREAEPFLEVAAETGDSDAAGLLGQLLQDRAMRWLRSAAEQGNGEAAHDLGDMLVGTGETAEAMRFYRTAVAAGREEVAASIGSLLHDWGQTVEAESWYRKGVDAGDARAAHNLALLLHYQGGWAEEAEALYRQAMKAGRPQAPTGLAVLLERQGRLVEAEPLYRLGHAWGDEGAAFLLAGNLKRRHRTAEAREWYRKAADAGSDQAAITLAQLDSDAAHLE